MALHHSQPPSPAAVLVQYSSMQRLGGERPRGLIPVVGLREPLHERAHCGEAQRERAQHLHHHWSSGMPQGTPQRRRRMCRSRASGTNKRQTQKPRMCTKAPPIENHPDSPAALIRTWAAAVAPPGRPHPSSFAHEDERTWAARNVFRRVDVRYRARAPSGRAGVISSPLAVCLSRAGVAWAPSPV
jgi:hypothetical protein